MQQVGTKTNNNEGRTDLLMQDDVGYADDAQLFIENDNREQICERRRNYDISTETRELEIQWAKVLLLVHAGREPGEETPPFGHIRISQGGTILGNGIYMTGNPNVAVEAGIQNANNTWKHVNRTTFRNMAFNRKIRILLRRSLIRSTMIYGLRAKGLKRHMIGKMGIYMFKHIRTTTNPNWKTEARYPEKTNSAKNCRSRRWNYGATIHQS